MGDVVAFKKQKVSQRHRGKSLCKSGFHKWVIAKNRHFDVKQGKLLTLFECERCGKARTKAL